MATRKTRFPELEKEFNVEIRTNLHVHQVARISNETGNVEVCPAFEFLASKVQKLVLYNLKLLFELRKKPLSQREVEADKISIDKMLEMYPNIDKEYWLRAFANLFTRNPSFQNTNRLAKLMSNLYYTERSVNEGFDGELDEGLSDAIYVPESRPYMARPPIKSMDEDNLDVMG